MCYTFCLAKDTVLDGETVSFVLWGMLFEESKQYLLEGESVSFEENFSLEKSELTYITTWVFFKCLYIRLFGRCMYQINLHGNYIKLHTNYTDWSKKTI